MKENESTKNESTPSQSRLSAGLSCSFCKKKQSEVGVLIASDEDAYICNECVMVCVDVIREDLRKTIDGMKALQEFAR